MRLILMRLSMTALGLLVVAQASQAFAVQAQASQIDSPLPEERKVAEDESPASSPQAPAPQIDANATYRLNSDYLVSLGQTARSLSFSPSGEVVMADNKESAEQLWKFIPLGGGKYRLINLAAGESKSLTTQASGNRQVLAMQNTDRSAGQIWTLTAVSEGKYRLSNDALGPGTSLSISALNPSFSQFLLQMVGTSSAPKQLWRLTVSTAPVATAPPAGDKLLCWKQTFGRGVGGIPTECPPGQEKDGGLCYPKCRDGFVGLGPVCWQKCPDRFRDDGAFCAKPEAYGRGAGYPWKFGDPAFDYGPSRSRCEGENGGSGSCEQDGLIYYPKCKAGFVKVGCCVCSPACPQGMTDIGVSCAKGSYTRGVGQVPGCAPGLEADAGLCYQPCPPAYTGVGAVCWGNCPSDFPFNCGAGCARDQAACAAAVGDMVMNTVGVAVNLLSFVAGGPGISAAARTAAKTALTTLGEAGTSGSVRLSNFATTRITGNVLRNVGNAGRTKSNVIRGEGNAAQTAGNAARGAGNATQISTNALRASSRTFGKALMEGIIDKSPDPLLFPGIIKGAANSSPGIINRPPRPISGYDTFTSKAVWNNDRVFARTLVKYAINQSTKSQISGWTGAISLKSGGLKAANEAAKEFGGLKETGDFDWTILTALDPTGISGMVTAFTKYGSCTLEPLASGADLLEFGTVSGPSSAVKTVQLTVQQPTTITEITTTPFANASISANADCVGQLLQRGQTCSVKVQVSGQAGVLGAVQIYTTDYDVIPLVIGVKANSSAAPATPIAGMDDAVNITAVVGVWAWQGNQGMKVIVRPDGTTELVGGPKGTVTVKDPINRIYEFKVLPSFVDTLTLSEDRSELMGSRKVTGFITPPMGVSAIRRPWDPRCKPGEEYLAGLCYDVPPDYSLTVPGFMGKPCPSGWRDDLTWCWPAWTGEDLPEAKKGQNPIMVTDCSRFGGANWQKCPPEFFGNPGLCS